ncbi:serine/threonine-protein kinase 31 [Brachyhypopomus gauderio]|uniref:serine/threonine-protein kinase 31 n=1 Tax=Brachyhypopomus gauderio TaxID=698409 RepID=UPI0040420778
MEQSRDADFDKMELVLVTHVVDAITFWAQNVTGDKATEIMDAILSEKCPTATRLTGMPSPQRLYGACYSEDRCWYRCKVQQLDDKFLVSYVDYGNTEVVDRSDLVELPEDLQSPALAKKYKFWAFHLPSDQDSPHYSQGKSFLQNLIYGKKLRINKKSVCFDGTILVQAFQGNLDIGEEVLKFKFARLSLPGNRESTFPAKALHMQAGLWPSRGLEGDGDHPSSLGYMPKLRPVFSNHKPEVLIAQGTDTTAHMPGADGKLENQENHPSDAEMGAQHLCSQGTEHMLVQTKSELQKVREELEEKNKEIEKLEEQKSSIQKHADDLEHQLKEARLELQEVSEVCQKKDECVEAHLDSTVGERFCRLVQNVEAVKKNRESNLCSTAGDHLLESITVVVNNQILKPFTSEKLDLAWEDYTQALKALRECQHKGELENLVNSRNRFRSTLLTMIDDFLREVDTLPMRERLESLKDIYLKLMAVCGSVLTEDTEDQSFEQFCNWKSQEHQNSRNLCQATDQALTALSAWAANISKSLCLTGKTGVSLENIAEGVDEILQQAESCVSEELDIKLFEPGSQDMKIMSNAFHKVMQHIQKEQQLLHGIMDKCEINRKFKQEMLQWQNSTPKIDELSCIKKRIKSLRSQLRWKMVEVGCLEEADELDLPEILKKKEEIAETRNVLFKEIGHEKEEYGKLCALVRGSFPELVLQYPEADISSYLSTEGLLMKSLDRDIFDAEPMKELSGRRPLVCTEFQGHKVVLKGYSVDEESEVRMLEQAVQYHRARHQKTSGVMPLLSLFFGKSDPLAYVMLPYISNGSLRTVQRNRPLMTAEIGKVMRGALVGLQSLHAACITHASLNPSNVFVLNREQGIIGDYDFTKTPEKRALDSGMVAGPISLVAPELRQGQPPTPASDMYAMGGLMLWLSAPDLNGGVEDDGQAPELLGLQLDSKLLTLLSKLMASSGRITVQEALGDVYFLSLED